jgi:hypothetical protein
MKSATNIGLSPSKRPAFGPCRRRGSRSLLGRKDSSNYETLKLMSITVEGHYWMAALAPASRLGYQSRLSIGRLERTFGRLTAHAYRHREATKRRGMGIDLIGSK